MGEPVKRYRSIINRLTIMVTGILVTAVLVVGGLALLGQYRQLHQALGTKAATLVQFMAQVTPLCILSLNFVEMNNYAKKVVLTDDEAVYAIILNEQGIPLAYFFKDTDPSVTGEVRDLVKNRKPLPAIEAMKHDGRIIEVSASISAGEKRIGSATLGFSSDKMKRALLIQTTVIGVVLVVIICLSIAMLRVVLRRILHPVQTLTSTANQISTGDLNVVPAGTDRFDELGVLSRAFESMVGQLRELISGLEQREHDLHQVTFFQRTLLDSAAYGIISIAPDGVITSFNPAAEQLLGYTAAEVVGKETPLTWHDPEELAQCARRLSEELGETIVPGYEVFVARARRGVPDENEWTCIRKDGTRVPVLLSVTALRDERDQITGFVGLANDLTERRRAEGALAESKVKYRRIVDTATEGIWMVGPDSMTTFVNARMAEILGCSGEEMIGRPFTDFMFDEDTPDHLQKMENRSQGMSESYERRFRRQDGQVVWTHVSASPIFDDVHHFIGSFAMFTDITERKRMETELKESEARYRYSSNLLASILESAVSVSVYALDREYRYLAFNRRHREGAKRLWGADIYVGMSMLDAIDTCEHREFCRQGFDKVLEGRSYFVESREVISGDGRQTVEYRDNYGSPIFNDDGDVVGLTVFAIDITERKRAEEDIRRLKNYLGNIIDSMPSILVGMDRDQIVTQWNLQAEEISGVPATKAIGRPITELLPDFYPWIDAMRSEIDQQRPASMEKLLIEKEGERRFYDLMLYPLISNGVEGAVVRIEDATERARIQELMIQTEKMISVGGLAAGMAHEINNPLGIITQAAQNIDRRVSPELPANRKAAEELGVSLEEINAYFKKRQIPEFIGSIREASLRASRIIANMLQFSRCAGTTMQPISLAGVIEQALELAASDYDLKKKYDFRSIEIIRDYEPNMPEVLAVPVEMEQVMLNLLKNATQAMILNPPDHRPRIALRLRREERYAVIEAEDNGPGMREEVRRRVFEPFFTTKEPGLGTGLGLSVSYMIVTQNHKGLMEVESKPGKGTCFRVSLPLSKEGIHE